jgi:hypothetical protein
MSEEEIGRAGSGTKRKAAGMNPKVFKKATPRVQELTIEDLQLLERVSYGSASPAGVVAELDEQDLRSLDDAFREAKDEVTRTLAKRLKQGETLTPEEQEIFNNWSCCCCTPCCCCAAADVDPFE